jgi:hypothetical protein
VAEDSRTTLALAIKDRDLRRNDAGERRNTNEVPDNWRYSQNGGASLATRPRQLEGGHPLCSAGLAWAWSGFFLLPYLGDLLTQSVTPTDMVERLGPMVTLPTMLTPMIAALIMRIFVSKE